MPASSLPLPGTGLRPAFVKKRLTAPPKDDMVKKICANPSHGAAVLPPHREAGENPAQSYLYCKRGQGRH